MSFFVDEWIPGGDPDDQLGVVRQYDGASDDRVPEEVRSDRTVFCCQNRK